MREVNAAWSVLGDPARRRAYDEGRATRPRSASSRGRPAPADPHDVDPVAEEQPVGFAVALLRALPLATVIGLLGLIFVFTAFANRSADPAGGDEEPAADVFAVGDCVQTLRQLRVHPCDGGHDAVIESLVAEQVDCTPPLQAWRLPELSGVACLAMYTG